MKSLKFLVIFVVILTLFSMTVFAATCGDGVAQGNEECDGSDVRGYTCPTMCYFNPNNPSDYSSNNADNGPYGCRTYGTPTCKSDCTFSSTSCRDPICGDGYVDGSEACDNGQDNSDTEEDACRTDCTNPSCGDGVVDSNEECDDGPQNDDEIPDACRTNCLEAHCGDGVVDPYSGEQCDNGVNDGSQGCYQCMDCYLPTDGLEFGNNIYEVAKLCSGTYTIADEGDEGVLIVNGYDITLDCNGAKLIGVDSTIVQANVNTEAQASMQMVNQQDQGQQQAAVQTQQVDVQAQQLNNEEEESGGFFAQVFSFVINAFTDEEEEEDVPPNNYGDSLSSVNAGTGILVSGENVVLVGCDVTNYANGIKVTGTDNVLANNKACGNSRDFTSTDPEDNFGAKNYCDFTYDWNEGGYEHCTYDCDDDLNDELVCEETVCNETVCEECPVCEEEVEEEPVEVEGTEVEEEETEVEEDEEETEEELTGEEECIEKYMGVGYTEEEATKYCTDGDEEDEEETEVEDEEPEEVETEVDEEETEVEDEEPEEVETEVEDEQQETNETVDEIQEEETTTTGDECIDKYIAEGYSEEKAKEECYGSDEETDETTTTGDECLDKYIAEGYSEEKAKEVCYGSDEEDLTEDKTEEKEDTTEKDSEEDECMNKYTDAGYSDEEAKKYCTETDEEDKDDTSKVTGAVTYEKTDTTYSTKYSIPLTKG